MHSVTNASCIKAIVCELLQVHVLLDQAARCDVDHHVSLTQIDEHVVFEKDWCLLSDEHSIANAQVLDHIVPTACFVKYLEVTSTVLLCRLLVLVRNHEVVDHALLLKDRTKVVKMMHTGLRHALVSTTYNGRLLLIQIVLVLLYDALLTAEEHKSITHIFAEILGFRLLLSILPHIRPQRLMRDKTERIYHYFLAFGQSC